MIRPLNNWVIVKPLEEKTLLYLPGRRNKWSERAEVISTGQNCKDVKSGDIVYLGNIPFQTVNKEEGLYAVQEKDIQGVIG